MDPLVVDHLGDLERRRLSDEIHIQEDKVRCARRHLTLTRDVLDDDAILRPAVRLDRARGSEVPGRERQEAGSRSVLRDTSRAVSIGPVWIVVDDDVAVDRLKGRLDRRTGGARDAPTVATKTGVRSPGATGKRERQETNRRSTQDHCWKGSPCGQRPPGR